VPVDAVKPLVTIVTPSFNQGAFLEETILSVLAQDYPNIEYIVMDGGSTDNSVEIIQKYADRISLWVSEPDQGQTDAINKGFAKAHGNILAWLNSDDLLTPRAVSEVVEYLTGNPGVGMVYSGLDFINAQGKVIGKFPARQTDLRKLRHGYVHVPQPATFFKADLWKKVGPLDPTFFFAMDYDLWTRIARLTTPVYLPGKVWAKFRLHGGGKTVTADERCWPEMLRVHYRDGGSWFSAIVFKYWLRKVASPWLNWRRARLTNRE
jgi:glycosyltransferase involved in cell wall biosynthesis